MCICHFLHGLCLLALSVPKLFTCARSTIRPFCISSLVCPAIFWHTPDVRLKNSFCLPPSLDFKYTLSHTTLKSMGPTGWQAWHGIFTLFISVLNLCHRYRLVYTTLFQVSCFPLMTNFSETLWCNLHHELMCAKRNVITYVEMSAQPTMTCSVEYCIFLCISSSFSTARSVRE